MMNCKSMCKGQLSAAGRIPAASLCAARRPVQMPRQASLAVSCNADSGANAASSSSAPRHQANAAGANVSRRQLINMGAATMAFLACPCCTNLGSEAKAEGWGYSTNVIITGPQYWPGTCSTGARQSPVNLPVRDSNHKNNPDYSELVFKYSDPIDMTFVSNPGHGSMQLNFSPGMTCVINGVDHDLLQYHFHTPSEHSFDGKRFSMEAHLVHKNRKTGGLAVVGVMLEPEGENNSCLEVGLVYAPQPGDRVNLKERVDPALLLPPPDVRGHRPYVHYSGSLTTPPCSEDVNWFVMTQPVKIGDRQILRFMKFTGGQRTYGQNSRPINPLLERAVDYDL